MKTLTIDDIEWSTFAEREDLPVDFQSGDPDYKAEDDALEHAVRERLESGDVWAWCYVRVVGRFEGLEASDSLGGCSYENRADFERCGYYDDMRANVVEELNEKVQRIVRKVAV